MRIFVAGGTGLVGSRLLARLVERNDTVAVLTRRPEVARHQWGNACSIVAGDPMQPGPWMAALADCDGVVNLVGEGIFNRRWRSAFKELLRASRVQSTQNIVSALQKGPSADRRAGRVFNATVSDRSKVLVNASAIGYYGPTGDEELDEASPPGNDTLARLCVDWESAALPVSSAGVRLVILRVGVVLDKKGGALKKMLLPFKMFVGGKVGSGKQWVSWIHHEDLVGMILLALDNPQASGPMNGTAPNPVTNKEFSRALGRALHRPSFMPTPRLALRVMLGEVANVITTGQRVVPPKALALGYAFKFSDIDAALRDVLAE